MSLFEGLLLCNILISAWVTYSIGKVKGDIEILYEGLALTMKMEEDRVE
jgi:hypothetical protein|tara:strand:- start:2510 stop:2656 length:147 start_codon:yes stop_codon:yes gene_type:complete